MKVSQGNVVYKPLENIDVGF